MSSGEVYRRPTWEPPTSGSGSSSSPAVEKWPTPDSGLWGNQTGANWTRDGTTLVSAAKKWPTPRAEERQQANSANVHEALSKVVTRWPTPSVTEPGFPSDRFVDAGGNRPAHAAQRLFDPETGTYRQKGLTQAAQIAGLWPTPTSSGMVDPASPTPTNPLLGRQVLRTGLPGSGSSPSGPTWPRPRLNPRFVSWLMGFPSPHWAEARAMTSSELTETRSCLRRSRSLCESFTGGWSRDLD